MQAHLLLPLRKIPSEVRQDILRLISGEINDIGQLTMPLAYWVLDEINSDDLEVFPIGECQEGKIYSVVKILDPKDA